MVFHITYLYDRIRIKKLYIKLNLKVIQNPSHAKSLSPSLSLSLSVSIFLEKETLADQISHLKI